MYKTPKFKFFLTDTPVSFPVSRPPGSGSAVSVPPVPVLGTTPSSGPLVPVLGTTPSSGPLVPVLGTTPSSGPLVPVLGTTPSSGPPVPLLGTTHQVDLHLLCWE